MRVHNFYTLYDASYTFILYVRLHILLYSMCGFIYFYALVLLWIKGEVIPWNGFKPSSKKILLTVPRQYFFCGSFMLFLSCVCYAFTPVFLLMPCGHWLGKGWTIGSCLWCRTSVLVSWIRCGSWLYWFLIFALILTFFKLLYFMWGFIYFYTLCEASCITVLNVRFHVLLYLIWGLVYSYTLHEASYTSTLCEA